MNLWTRAFLLTTALALLALLLTGMLTMPLLASVAIVVLVLVAWKVGKWK